MTRATKANYTTGVISEPSTLRPVLVGLIVCLLLTGVSGTALGQAVGSEAAFGDPFSPVEPAPYDLGRVVERALTYNLGIKIARLQQAAAEEQLVQQQVALRPELTAGVRPTWFETPVPDFSALEDVLDVGKLLDAWADGRTEFLDELDKQLGELSDEFSDGIPQKLETGRGYTVSLTGNVPLWRSPLQRAVAKVADLQRRHADVDVEAAAAGAIMQSIDAYFGVLRAEQALQVATLALQEAEARAAETAAKLTSGTATRVDLLQVEAERFGAEAEVVQARGEVSVARMALNSALGLDLNVPLTLQPLNGAMAASGSTGDSLRAVGGIPPLNEALSFAAKRGDVRKARTDWELAETALLVATEQAKPGLQLFGNRKWPDAELTIGIDRHGYLGGSVSHTDTYLGGERVKGDPASWAVGVELSWPLVDGGERRAKVEEARLQAEQAALFYEHVRQTSQTDVLAAHARLKAAEQALTGARQGIAAATEAVQIARELAAAGAATDVAVVRAQLALAQAQQGHLEATYGATMARTSYLQAAGLLVDYWLSVLDAKDTIIY